MNILVLGAGAVGGYFGGRLAEAGADVTFLVRPERARKLAERGLVVKSPLGDIARPVATVQAEAIAAPYDVVLLTCKAYDLEAAMKSVAPAIGPGSAVLSLLNGLAHIDALQRRYGAERILGGACHIGSTLSPEGHVLHLNELHAITFGELSGGRSSRAQEIAKEFGAAKFTTVLSDRIVDVMWEKFVMLATLAAMSTATRATVGEIMAVPEGKRVMVAVLAECEAAARASGHPLIPETVERTRRMLTDRGSGVSASMRRDMEQGGPTESDHILGDLVRRGEAKGVATPLLRLALCNLQVHEARRKKERV